MRYRQLLIIILLAGQSFCALSASIPTIRYGGKYNDLPAVGLRFNAFRDMNAIPFAPPQQTGRVWTRRDTGAKIFGYNLMDLWRHDQMIGQWKNDMITVTVAELKVNVPTNVQKIDPNYDDVLQGSYSDWKQKTKTLWGQGSEARWLQYYTGAELQGNPGFVKGCKNPTYQHSFADSTGKSVLYLVRSKVDPSRRFMFYYQASGRLDKKERKAILYSIKSVYTYKPKKTKVAQVKGSSRYKKKEWSDKYLASKAQVVASIQNMKGWRLLETENYIIVSNLRSGIVVKKFQEHLEKSRIAYQKFFPLKIKLDEVSVVKIFEDRSEYVSYVGEGMKWSGGLWMPMRKELMVSPLETKSKSKNQLGMMETVSHEGFHQYIYYAVNQGAVSTWFNEGTAAFFEGLKFSGSRSFKIGATWRQDWVHAAIKKGYDDIATLINMSQREYYRPDRISYNYAMGWGLMFYLYKGAHVVRRPKYAEIPKRYYDELLRTHDPQKATRYAWSNVNMNQFQKDFKQFWRSKAYISKATKLDIQRVLKNK